MIHDPEISRRHFEVTNEGEHLRIRDLGSAAGTYVNGKPVQEATVRAGEAVEAGARSFVALRVQGRIPRPEAGTLEAVIYHGDVALTRRALTGPIVVGRGSASDVIVRDRSVSRRHLEIRPAQSGTVVRDLDSANGIQVNGRAVKGERAVSVGDRIQLGDTDHVVVIEAPASQASVVEIEIFVEGSERTWSVEVDAGIDSSVGDVAARMAAYLNVPLAHRESWTLVRPDDHVVLHPSNRWVDAGVARGDLLEVIRIGEIPEAGTDTGRHGSSRVTLSQLPRSVAPPDVHEVRLPPPPESASLRDQGITWQLVGGVGIAGAGVVVALIRPEYLAFALIGVVVGIFSVGASVMGERSRRSRAVRRFRERVTELDEELIDVRSQQANQLREEFPSPGEAVVWVAERSRRLWERRAGDSDFLSLRLGTGRRRALVRTDGETTTSDSPLAAELTDMLDRHVYLDDVPVLLPGPDAAQVVGIVGPRREVLEAASWLTLQAAVLHAPADLEIAVPAVTQDWLWTRWLPHVEGPEGVDVAWDERTAVGVARRIRARLEPGVEDARRGGPELARLIVVAHGSQSILADMLGAQNPPQTQFLVLADALADLPSRVDAVVHVEGETARLEHSSDEGLLGTVDVDRIDEEVAAKTARRLGRYADRRRPPRRASTQVGLLDLLGVRDPANLDVPALWAASPTPPLSAMVGSTLDDEPLVLGFRSDGVHGVVGGTTGSGKSEFLQTLLVSLALTHRPDRLSFFLIDFKGGATFAALSTLPHVVGVVTDLEQHAALAGRAFTALEAEMARRKRQLDRARVPSLIEYEQLREAQVEPMPALLVVIDEFALLVRQQPEVKDRLDLVATQGRSLGVHLLLATQSPSNVVTPAIRSNTQVWISLRVVDDSESTELLGRRDAARIPADRPGRGFVRFGGSPSIVGFQVARIARPTGSSGAGASVTVRAFADEAPDGPSVGSRATSKTGRIVTELEEVCARIGQQAERVSVRRPSPLWLEPLPEYLPAPTSADGLVRKEGEAIALVGLVDDPARHLQESWTVDVAKAGNVLVLGARGTGKSTTLRQLVLDLAEQHGPDVLHVYAIESGTGSLGPLAGLPHCGGVVATGDRERLHLVFDRLVRLMERRRSSLAMSGVGDFAAWRRSLAAPEARVLLVIDDFPAFKEVSEASGLGVLHDQLLSLAQGGPAVGIHLVVASTQSADLRMTLMNLFGARIMHRPVDAADYSLLDLRVRPGELPPVIAGRALVAGGFEMQVFAPSEARVDEIRLLWQDAGPGPRSISRLPTEIPLPDILALAPGGAAVPIGVGGEDYGVVAVDLDRSERHMLIVGEGRTGRSTALLTIHQALVACDASARFVVLAPRVSPLRSLMGRADVLCVATTTTDIAEWARDFGSSAADSVVLLVDDAESIPPEAGDQLERILRDADQTGVRSFIAGRSADIARSFEGWTRYLMSLRHGLVLMPGPDGGAVFDARLPVAHVPLAPGRGYLCERSNTTLVQLALPQGPVGER